MARTDVASLLRHRAQTQSQPGRRTDGCKVGLVVEGGGMRGVVSAGMVAALEVLGLTDCFDKVYGSSAGAINGAYFVARQAVYGTTIYYQNINNRSFVSRRRLFHPRTPALSLEFLLDHVCVVEKPLDWQRIIDSPIPLCAIASSIDQLKAVALEGFQSSAQLFAALHASARVPIVAGPPALYGGERMWDAMIFEPIPFRTAIADGCTHILVLLTRPRGHLRAKPGLFDRFVIAPLMARHRRELRRIHLERDDQYAQDMTTLAKLADVTAEGSCTSLTISVPDHAILVDGGETDREALIAGARSGFESVYAALGERTPQVVEVLAPFSGGHKAELNLGMVTHGDGSGRQPNPAVRAIKQHSD